jgi:hypothetical protein
MGIIQNYNNGSMDALRSVTYSETGTVSPYVVKDIKNPNPNPLGLELNKRIDDTSRIAQMLIDKPGLKWIGNQTLLSQAELASKAKAAADGKKTGVGKALAGFAAAAGQVLKIVGSTVAQVPVNGTGTHFVRGFKTDTYLQPAGEGPSGFAQFFGAGGIEGAPLALNGETIIPDNTGQSVYSPLVNSDLKARQEKIVGIPDRNSRFSLENGVYKYPYGGRNSDLLSDNKVSIKDSITSDESTTVERTTQLIDYRKLEGKNYRSNTYTLNYQDPLVNKETRVGLGNQGKKKSRVDYTVVEEGSVDTVNFSPVASDSISPQADPDFVQLSFDIITPEDTYFIQFRAFLETFSDTFSADWGKTKYIGRAEDFYTYNGFSRQVNIGFKIAAATRSEMLPIYNKINTLASVTAPTYGGTESKFMRGTIARVTVGDYLYNVPGIIDSVDFSWQTEYSWEINAIKPDGEEDTMPVLPHILDCSLNFKPIHDFVPESGLTPFISNNPKKGIS